MRTRWSVRALTALLALILLVGLVPMSVAQAPHKKNFAQRHPTMTSIGAGYAAYKAAKITGKNRARVGRKKNFAQRHPILTGMAAGMATHHMIKKSIKHQH